MAQVHRHQFYLEKTLQETNQNPEIIFFLSKGVFYIQYKIIPGFRIMHNVELTSQITVHHNLGNIDSRLEALFTMDRGPVEQTHCNNYTACRIII